MLYSRLGGHDGWQVWEVKHNPVLATSCLRRSGNFKLNLRFAKVIDSNGKGYASPT
jgi:hypothetical protein